MFGSPCWGAWVGHGVAHAADGGPHGPGAAAGASGAQRPAGARGWMTGWPVRADGGPHGSGPAAGASGAQHHGRAVAARLQGAVPHARRGQAEGARTPSHAYRVYGRSRILCCTACTPRASRRRARALLPCGPSPAAPHRERSCCVSGRALSAHEQASSKEVAMRACQSWLCRSGGAWRRLGPGGAGGDHPGPRRVRRARPGHGHDAAGPEAGGARFVSPSPKI